MNAELHQLLLKNDVQGQWEYPPGANWSREISRVRELVPELESTLHSTLRLDEGIQDASFFADVGVLEKQPRSDGIVHHRYRICIRFSWFGDMFTIWGENVSEYNTSEAIRVLRERGYKFVPASELDEPYDGVNKPYESGLTWWVRYFDWL